MKHREKECLAVAVLVQVVASSALIILVSELDVLPVTIAVSINFAAIVLPLIWAQISSEE